MDDMAKLISAIASLAWPLVLAVLLFKLYDPIRMLVESGKSRKFTLKVAGNELTMEEASEQQRAIVTDLQSKIAQIEKAVSAMPGTKHVQPDAPPTTHKRILWVDDNPKNNSFLVAALEERGARVDIALNTADGLAKFKKTRHDIVLSDMSRPEGERAGIDLAKRIKSFDPSTPIYIFCGGWAARNLRTEALDAGVTEITSSGTTLLGALPLENGS